MIEIISNGSKWAGQKTDSIQDLLTVLEKYTLDPTFEEYGNFIKKDPEYLKPELTEKYKGCSKIFGNFLTLSHVFNIITDDQEIISLLSEAIKKNQQTEEYKAAREKRYNSKREQQELTRKYLNNEITTTQYNQQKTFIY